MARTAFCITALLACLAASPAVAGTTFSNGVADIVHGGGREMSAYIQADDFVFSTDTSVTGASLEWFTSGRLASWDHTIRWYIFADASNAPGSLLASGSALNVLSTFDGSTNFDRYSTSFDFDHAVDVSAGGRYWFGLHFSSDFASRDNLYWADSTSQQMAGTFESQNGTMNNWVDVTGTDRSFTLIPAPTSVALVGVSAIFASRRRR